MAINIKHEFTMFPGRCYNGGRKHKFKPVYTEHPMQPALSDDVIFALMEDANNVDETFDMREFLVFKEYVGHVCEWCGQSAVASAGGTICQKP